ncbi:unnamed protein product, partial [marine sediment metagenome]
QYVIYNSLESEKIYLKQKTANNLKFGFIGILL